MELPEVRAMHKISRTAQTHSRGGFTLIEMMVIVVLLAMFSAMVAPNLVAMRDSQQRRAFYTGAADLAGLARELAISTTSTVYLQADSSGNALVLKREDESSTYQNTANGVGTGSSGTAVINGRVQSTRTTTNIGTNAADHANDTTVKSVPLIAGIQFGNFQLAGSSSDSGNWKLHFYADGTSDGGGFELVDRRETRSVVINTRGGCQLTDGTLPDTSQDRWAAGDYVHRQ